MISAGSVLSEHVCVDGSTGFVLSLLKDSPCNLPKHQRAVVGSDPFLFSIIHQALDDKYDSRFFPKRIYFLGVMGLYSQLTHFTREAIL